MKEKISILIELIKSNKLLAFISVLFLFFTFYLYHLNSQIKREIMLTEKSEGKEISGYEANYKKDMGFLSCIAEQHTCLFKNLKSNNYELIIKRCKDENFCAIEYSTSNQ